MGIIAQGNILWRTLFTRTQCRVLGLLFGHPERSFYANQVVRLAGVGTGAVQRELARLAEAGLVAVTRTGNQKHFQANPDCPFYPELRSMVLKTHGALGHLRSALAAFADRIELALLYGPGADELATPGADLHVLVVSDALGREDIEPAADEACRQIGRNLKLVLLRQARYTALRASDDAALRAALEGPHIVLKGQPT